MARGLNGFIVFFFTVSAFPFVMEICGAKWRSTINAIWGTGFTIGGMLLSWPFAFYLSNWHDLHFAISFLMVPAALASLVIPESYKWYISQDRTQEAKDSALKLAITQKNLSETEKTRLLDVVEEISATSRSLREENGKNKLGFFVVFKFRKMTLITLNFMFQWFVNSFAYYGLALNAGNLPGTDIVNNMILCGLEIPAYLLMPFLMDNKKIGRRRYLAYGLVLAGLCCVASTILLEFKSCEAGAAELSGQIFAYLGKFFVAGTFQAIYIHTAEAYSTDVRADCIGLCSVSARLGGIIAPFVLSTADIASWMPGMMFGVVSVVSGLAAFFLPETLGQPMLYTIEEAEKWHSRVI